MSMPTIHRILTTAVLCIAAGACVSCTRLNLVEQLEPADRRVPIVNQDEARSMQATRRQFTLYELNGCYYVPLTVYMGKEDVPLFGLRYADMETALGKLVRYEPELSTAKVWLFPLTDEEAAHCLKELHPGQADVVVRQPHDTSTAPVIDSSSPDFKRARSCGKVLCFCPESLRANQDSTYCTTPCIPAEKGTRSLGYYAAYGPIWCVDAAGNILLFATESAIAIPCGIVLWGLVNLAAETSPHG